MMHAVPSTVAREAQRALDWRAEGQRGGTSVGWNTARMLANDGAVSDAKVRHIACYFPRHAVDKRATGFRPGERGFPSPGRVAWALWGGDAGRTWARSIAGRRKHRAHEKEGGYDNG